MGGSGQNDGTKYADYEGCGVSQNRTKPYQWYGLYFGTVWGQKAIKTVPNRTQYLKILVLGTIYGAAVFGRNCGFRLFGRLVWF